MNNTTIIASGGLPPGEVSGRRPKLGRTARYSILVAALALASGAVLFDRDVLRVVCGLGATLFVMILVASGSRTSAIPVSKDVDPRKLYTKQDS
jgi:hypothetical protein